MTKRISTHHRFLTKITWTSLCLSLTEKCQLAQTAPVLRGASGKPSTRLPPRRPVELLSSNHKNDMILKQILVILPHRMVFLFCFFCWVSYCHEIWKFKVPNWFSFPMILLWKENHIICYRETCILHLRPCKTKLEFSIFTMSAPSERHVDVLTSTSILCLKRIVTHTANIYVPQCSGKVTNSKWMLKFMFRIMFWTFCST